MVPFEQALVKRLENQPFALLGFNGDADETQLKTILHEQGITWRSWWMSGEAFSTVARIWSPEGVPTLYAIDRRGIVRYKFLGFPGAATIDRLVDGLLKERNTRKAFSKLDGKSRGRGHPETEPPPTP